MKRQFVVGLDLGQSQDFTGLVILEKAEFLGAWNAATFAHEVETAVRMRYIERMPLGTSYPDIVTWVGRVMESKGMTEGKKSLVVDATGVGRPVVDLLERAEMPCKILPVTITGGATEGMTKGAHRVPKRDLIMGLLVMLQEGELEIAKGLREGEALMKELADMRVQMTSGGRERYGAKSGAHDDLVMAAALAVWGVKWIAGRGTVGERAEGRVV
jgi:hypothetical protein